MHELGVIHGRFQILHHDHMKYLMAGKDRCRRLIVGITNPDPGLTGEDAANPERSESSANPLTYYERYCLITAALRDAGLSPEEFAVVPFPVNYPELYRYYVPLDAVFFLTIYDEWGRRKRDMFEVAGLRTEVMWERPEEQKGITASDVRRRMARDEPWDHLVPDVVARLLREWDIPNRLAEVARSDLTAPA